MLLKQECITVFALLVQTDFYNNYFCKCLKWIIGIRKIIIKIDVRIISSRKTAPVLFSLRNDVGCTGGCQPHHSWPPSRQRLNQCSLIHTAPPTLAPEMTYYMLNGTLSCTHSLTLVLPVRCAVGNGDVYWRPRAGQVSGVPSSKRTLQSAELPDDRSYS